MSIGYLWGTYRDYYRVNRIFPYIAFFSNFLHFARIQKGDSKLKNTAPFLPHSAFRIKAKTIETEKTGKTPTIEKPSKNPIYLLFLPYFNGAPGRT